MIQSRIRALKAVLILSSCAIFGAVAGPNASQDALSTLSESKRNSAFTSILSGEKCGTVTRSMYQGSDNRNNVFWSLECNNGEAYQIMIAANTTGSTRLLNCKVLKAVNSSCFKRF